MANIVNINRPKPFNIKWTKAEKYIKEGQLIKALSLFEELAVEGYTEAYVEIGNILERGDPAGISQDLNAARSWYMRAIEESGDIYAYIGLARLALNGYRDAGTLSDAVEYLEIAVNGNNPIALTILGSLYHAGNIVPQNLNRASELYAMAIVQGYVLPMAYMAKLKWEQGHFLTALRLRFKVMWEAFKLARNDLSDPRLWNYL